MSFFFTFYNVLIESVTLTAFLSWLSFRWRRASVTTLISILILETVISTAQETLATVCPSTLTDLTPRLTIYYFNVFFFCKIKVICQCNKTFFFWFYGQPLQRCYWLFKKNVLNKNKLVDKLVLKFNFFFVHRKILQRLEQYGWTCLIWRYWHKQWLSLKKQDSLLK